jgi:cytochrome c oxidase subunit 2
MFSGSYIENVDNTFFFIVAVSLILLLAITFLMIYFVFKYNRKKGVKAENIHGSTTLEITWTVIPLILVMAMFYMGWVGYEQLSNPPADAMIVKAQAKMWKWEFEYPNGVKADTMFVPYGKAVRVNITSVDVNHSFYVPAFRFKRDAIANRVNFVWFKAEKLGSYDIACAEYCGLNHSKMYTKLVIIPEAEYNAWLTNQKALLNAANAVPAK